MRISNVIFLLLLLLKADLIASGPGDSIIQLVTVPETEITLMEKNKCEIRFFLREKAYVTVEIVDADYQLVRTIAKDKQFERGTISLYWDGKDDNGKLVPAFAYIPLIFAIDSNKKQYVYDPRANTGWRPLTVNRPVYDNDDCAINFLVSKPSYVRVRIGSNSGPLYHTPINWELYFPGKHSYKWDGLDESGKIDITQYDFLLLYQAMTLPEGTIFIIDSPVTKRVLEKDVEVVTRDVFHEQYFEEAKANPFKKKISKGNLPQFEVAFPQARLNEEGIAVVTSRNPVSIKVDSKDIEWLTSARYEILMWVDGVYMAEEEEGYAPLTWLLDTTKFQNGYHVLTIMVQSFTDRIGTQSMWIDIQN